MRSDSVQRSDLCYGFPSRGMPRSPLSAGLQLANRILRPFGVRLQRTNVPTPTFSDFFEHLKKMGFEARTVIDVGVAYGTPQIYRAFPGADYVLVEPLEEFRPILESLKRTLKAHCVPAAAGPPREKPSSTSTTISPVPLSFDRRRGRGWTGSSGG